MIPTTLAALVILTARNELATPPIVFLPGTGGSVLRSRETGEVYWIGASALRPDFLALGDPSLPKRLYASDVLTSVGQVEAERLKRRIKEAVLDARIPLHPDSLDQLPDGFPVYAPFIEWARNEFGKTGFYTAPYDWRLRPAANMQQVDAVVERARCECHCSKVILVCHSLGGLVGREYLATIGKEKVAHFIAVGTPWLGTPQAPRALLRGSDFGVGITMSEAAPGRVKAPDFQVPVHDILFGELTRTSPTRISFLPSQVTRQLARSFPSVYLMNPPAEAGIHLKKLLGSPTGEIPGVVAEWNAEELDSHLNRMNPNEHRWARTWRSEFLSGSSHGVPHHLIGLVSPSSSKSESWQYLRFSAQERPRVATLPRQAQRFLLKALGDTDGPDWLAPLARKAGRVDQLLSAAPLNARRELIRQIDRQTALTVELDEFVPTHADRRWGDGTVPLFSATAGAVECSGSTLADRTACARLGSLTRVHSIELQAGQSHASAMNDPGVRDLLSLLCKPKTDSKARSKLWGSSRDGFR